MSEEFVDERNMDEEEVELHKQIEQHTKRLRILEERAALRGFNTPPEELIEISEITERIDDLKMRLSIQILEN